MSLGSILRAMREQFVGDQFEEIAARVPVAARTITENWETEAREPKVRDLFNYIRLLRNSAAALNLAEEFENARLDMIRELDSDWWRLLTSPDRDERTPGEKAQDLVDYHSGFEVFRPRRIREVDAEVAKLDPAVLVGGTSTRVAAATASPVSVFDVTAVFPIDKSTITIQRRASWRSPYLFSIDLRDQRCSIHNETGKAVLREFIASEDLQGLLSQASDRVQDFFHELPDGRSCSWREMVDSKLIPLRWASGGVLPVARLRKKGLGGKWESDGDWLVLFFRDIDPIGLNVGNGASEGLGERRDLEQLISREFAEELILLSERPSSGKTVVQAVFFDETGGRALAGTEQYLDFVQAHQSLRLEHDNVTITFNPAQAPRFLHPMSTPFAARVMDSGEYVRR